MCSRCGNVTCTEFVNNKWINDITGKSDGCFISLDKDNQYQYGCRWEKCSDPSIFKYVKDKKTLLEWNDYISIIEEIKKDPIAKVIFNKVDNVIGIERGGLIPAVCLSHHFEKNFI